MLWAPELQNALPAGFEPATYGLEIRCSIQLSYGSVAVSLRDQPCLARQPEGEGKRFLRWSAALMLPLSAGIGDPTRVVGLFLGARL